MRLFAGLYPPQEALAHLDGALAGVAGEDGDLGASLRWVPREQRHVTLAFLGEVPDGALPDVEAALARAVVGHAPLALRLAGAGTFGDRTLWVGLAGDRDGLRDLSQDVAAALGDEAGVVARDRAAGRPHLTVARLRAGAAPSGARRRRGAPPAVGPAPLAARARALGVYSGPGWTAQEVVLVSSVLGAGRSGGPAHDAVARFPLVAPAGDEAGVGGWRA